MAQAKHKALQNKLHKSPYSMGRFATSIPIVPIEKDKKAQKKLGITKKHLTAKKQWEDSFDKK